MHIRVLGTVELTGPAGGYELQRSPRMRRLLAGLVVGTGSVVSVDRLAETLWGDKPPADPASAVHHLVSRLRSAVRSSGCGTAVQIVTRPPGYLLAVSEGELDSARFAQLVGQARERRGNPKAAAALLDEALALWRGPPYGEFADDEFAAPDATRLEELRWAAVADRVDAALALGRPDEAIGLLDPLLAAQPLAHRPRGQRMLALHRAGRSVEALETYHHYRDSLAEELGLDPPPELGELEAAILRHDRAVDQGRPVHPSSNLPHQITDLIGRAGDAALVTEAINKARLVTLTGVGGVGKTRLALHVAAELTQEYPDGVWLCELAPVDGDAVATVLAGVLDVARGQPAAVPPSLVEYLATKKLLVVLDNCEHVGAEAAGLADALLRGCRWVRMLATSREPLGVEGERVVPIAPLETADAVALFVQRAAAALPSFGLTERNAADVAEICRRLDGLPLALELVAPKVRSLSVPDIVAGLDRRLQFVRTAGRVREQRHRTLRAVVDWSYQLLDEQQRQVFDRLSVFAGSFTVAAAQRVAGSGLDAGEVVTELVDRSMLSAQTDEAPTRYTMLDTLRHYGQERLDALGWLASTQLEHACYHAELAEAASAGLTGPDPGPWSKTIDRHLDDLRAAHNWSVQHEPDLAMRLAAALYWYVEAGSSSEVTLWAQRSVSVAAPRHPLLPIVLSVAAWGASKRGDLSGARDLADRALTAAADHAPMRRYALFVLGDVALFDGRLDDAVRCYDRVAHFAEVAGDTYSYAYARANAALALAYGSDEASAVEAARSARSMAVAASSPYVIAWADYVLGEALSGVDPGEALAAVDAALVTARDTRHRFMEGVALVSAASLRARHGDPHAALDLFGQVIDHWQRAGNWTQQWITLRNVLDLFARLGADEPAAILCGALGASRRATPPFGADADRLASTSAALRARLGEQRHRDYLACGAAMTDDDAVTFAAAEIDRAARNRNK